MKSSFIRVQNSVHRHTRWLVVYGLLCLVASCQPNSPLETQDPDPNDELSIAEAKAWFTDYLASPANARTSADDKFVNRKADWDNAYNYALTKKQKMVVVPISHYKRGTTPEYKQLWVYKNKFGKNTMRVVEYVFASPTTNKAQTIRDFTGYLLIKDWDDNVLGGFEMKSNRFVGALSKQNAGGRTSGFLCGDWLSCRLVTVGHANDPSGGNTYLSCTSDYYCIWASVSEQTDAPISGSQSDPGGGSVAFPQDPTPPEHDWEYNPKVFDTKCAGLYAMAYHTATVEEAKESSAVHTKEGKLIIFPSQYNDKQTAMFYPKYRDSNGKVVLTFLEETKGIMTVRVISPNGTEEVYTATETIHTHPDGVSNCDEPSPADYQNKRGDRFHAQQYPMLKHYILGCSQWIEYDGGTFTKKSPYPYPNFSENCK
jgi:hypothetical protein